MGIDFRAIRNRLKWRVIGWRFKLHQLGYVKLSDAKIAKIETKIQEIVALHQELSEKFKNVHEKALFAAVGEALSFWAAMEETLVVITGLLLGTDFSKIGLIMYHIINFHVWINIIDELLLMEAEYIALRPKWNKISESLRRLKDDRDRLAHHTVHSKANIATTDSNTHLRPGRFDTRSKSLKFKPMDFDKIHVFTNTLSKVFLDLSEFLDDLVELLRASREKPPE